MTSPDIGCDRFEAMASEYVDGELDARARSDVDRHAAACGSCRDLLQDIIAMRDSARSLPLLSPSRDLWAGIDARIAAPIVAIDHRARQGWPVRRLTAVAAAALIAVSSGLTYMITRSVAPTPPVDVARTQPTPATEPAYDATSETAVAQNPTPGGVAGRDVPGTKIDNPVRAALVSATRSPGVAERLLAPEIAGLQQVLDARRNELDPATVKVVEDNLALIDAAVRQAKAALRRDPASGFLTDMLDGVLQKKVELLRTAALLPSKS